MSGSAECSFLCTVARDNLVDILGVGVGVVSVCTCDSSKIDCHIIMLYDNVLQCITMYYNVLQARIKVGRCLLEVLLFYNIPYSTPKTIYSESIKHLST